MLSDFIGFSLRHSHMAECITVSTIVSIPKHERGSMIYRGICLCSSILKLFDIIMLNISGAKLKSSDLPFAYKAGMSTTMCSTMPMLQSHCVESTAEWGRIDNSSLLGWSFLIILAMTMTMTINSNSVLLIPCSFGRSAWKFWTCSKISCSQQCPAQILFIRGYAHWKRVVIFFVTQLAYCILVIRTVFLVVLTVYYVIRAWQWDWGRPEDSAK